MIAVATLLVIVTITLIVNRVGMIALTATGLSSEVAHFQARSALTGVGFTTVESDLVVNHPVRRRIVLGLMLIGNAGMVTIIATMVVGFAGTGATSAVLGRVLTLAAGLLVILLAARSKTIDRLLTRVIAAALRRFTDLDVRDYVQLLDLASNYAVAEIGVEADSWVAEHRLADLRLPDEGVLALGIRRADGTFLGAPRGHTRIHEHDTLIVYGYTDVLDDLGTRKVGMEGDRIHEGLISKVADRQAEEDALDQDG
ncbi:MAG TPA: TrkA C-terminal domain-containing protein [Acidimicrobiia bacterium]|jgi:K+/H+ antiporter YhaU regulatory subunit KhtT|nr:TrkA C-terminal domain-containing protein [Acidimicrobiia bacterium]